MPERKRKRKSGRKKRPEGGQGTRRRKKKEIVEPQPVYVQRGSVRREKAPSSKRKLIIIVILLLIVIVGVVVGVVVSLGGDGTTAATTLKPTVPPTKKTTTTPSPPPVNLEVDENWKAIRGDCGMPKQKPYLGRIVGGSEAVKHSWPWQIGLLKYKRFSSTSASVKAICGGSLVGPKYVITAVHCFLNSKRTATSTTGEDYRVLVGGHDKGKESGGARMIEIAQVNHHPKNNLATFSKLRQLPVHDITVVILKKVIDPNVVSPVTAFACLPKPKFLPPPGKRCWASGWGKTMGTGYDKVLKQVAQPVVSELNCRKKYGSKDLKSEIHLCAGPEKGSQGTCQGDSGGPLVCQYADGSWVLHGDTSFGPQPCGTSPGVWAQVSYHMEWICCILKGYGPCREVKCVMP